MERLDIDMGSEEFRSKFRLVQIEDDIKDIEFESEPIGYFKDSLNRFKRNKASLLSFFMIAIITFMSIFGPSFNEYSFRQQNLSKTDMPPKIPFLAKFGIADGTRVLYNRRVEDLDNLEKYPEGSILEVTNKQEIRGVDIADIKVDYYVLKGAEEGENYWLGTDNLGRDMWTRLWRGSRVSLIIALLSVIVNVIIGVIYGGIAGFYGGKVDLVMMRICEIIGAFPHLVIVTMFIMVFGTGMFSIIMSLVVQGWIGTARMIRAQFIRFKDREYVLASKTLGVKDSILIFRHILPNSIGPIITRTTMAIPGAIFSESFLAYIGLGLKAPEPSIGVLLSEGQKTLLHYPYQTLFPAILISILMISFNLLGNGLRDALNPTMRGKE